MFRPSWRTSAASASYSFLHNTSRGWGDFGPVRYKCLQHTRCVCLSFLKPLPPTLPSQAENGKYEKRREKRKKSLCGLIVLLTCIHSGNNGAKTQRNVVINISVQSCTWEHRIQRLHGMAMSWKVLHGFKCFMNHEYKGSMHFELILQAQSLVHATYPEEHAARSR